MVENEKVYGRAFNLREFMKTTPEHPEGQGPVTFFSSVWLSAELSPSEFRQDLGTGRNEKERERNKRGPGRV